jgi:transposase
MMLHGARSVVMHMARKKSALGAWVEQLSARTHRNVAVVALANKMARIAWVILNKSERYRPAALTPISLGPAAAT